MSSLTHNVLHLLSFRRCCLYKNCCHAVTINSNLNLTRTCTPINFSYFSVCALWPFFVEVYRMKGLRNCLVYVAVYFASKIYYPPLLLGFIIFDLNDKFSGALKFDFSPMYVESRQRCQYNDSFRRPRNRISILVIDKRFFILPKRPDWLTTFPV